MEITRGIEIFMIDLQREMSNHVEFPEEYKISRVLGDWKPI